ncbi:hypothetical protein V3W47_00235 [Deinococcus sp. YIM 134068]|uniref:hypothetical protein n=1 Tax=Deinococcus lichenicola TaxID=3118910 RepID=UPI002F95846E
MSSSDTGASKKSGLPSFATSLAIFLWTYPMLNTFIVNVDNIVLDLFGLDRGYSNFKYVLFFLFVIFLLYKYKARSLLWLLLYVSFFPLILFLLIVPAFFLYKSKITLLLIYAWSVLDFVFSFKKRVVGLMSFIVGITCCLVNVDFFNNIGIVLMLYFVYNHIMERVRSSLDSSWLPTGEVSSLVGQIQKQRGFETELQSFNDLDENKRQSTLSQAVFYSSLMSYITRNTIRFNKSGVYVWLSYSKIAFTVTVIIVCFTFINYSIYNINSINFRTIKDVTLFDFFYYTLFNSAYAQVDDVKASSDLAQLFSALQIVSMASLLPPIITFFSTYFSSSLSKDLETISETARKRDQEFSDNLKHSIAISLNDAKEDLYRKGDLFAVIAIIMDGNTKVKLEDVLKKLEQDREKALPTTIDSSDNTS